MGLNQHGSIEPCTTVEVVIDQGQAHLGPVCDRFGGGLGVAISGEEFTCCFQEALSGRLPIGTASASGLGHRVVD